MEVIGIDVKVLPQITVTSLVVKAKSVIYVEDFMWVGC